MPGVPHLLSRRLAGVVAVSLYLAGSGAGLRAETKVLRIDPRQTDAAIEAVHGSHLAVYDPQVASNHRLFVFFVGTEAKAEGSLTIDSAFAKWGYHAIALDYENNVITVVCAHSLDSACFDHYREANITGAPVSDTIKVEPANSILNRLEKLLAYLAKQDPDGGWGEFMTDGQPAWSRFVVAGHSQGAGHAAYLGKLFAVDAVLMFSGPQDYFNDLDKPAPWLSRPSATPPSRFFASLSLNDPFNVHHQTANCSVLMGAAKPETLMVQPGEAVHGDYQIFINDAEARGAHGSTLSPEFENVWKYLAAAGAKGAVLRPAWPVPPEPIPFR